jgi:hypothetical protein
MKINIKQEHGKEAINNLIIFTSEKETEQERYNRTQKEIIRGIFEE